MDAPAIVEKLKQHFGSRIAGSNLEAIDPWVEVAPEAADYGGAAGPEHSEGTEALRD